MSNYCVYAALPENVKRMISNVRNQFKNEFESTGQLTDVPTEEPHVTVAYGPKYQLAHEQEVTTFDATAINELYPGFLSEYTGVLPVLEFRGVAHFDRPNQNRYIIGLEFHCPQLTAMRKHIYNSSEEMTNTREKNKEAIMNVAFDKSWDESPERWIHVTIANVGRESDVLKMQQFLRDKLVNFPSTVPVVNVQLISAVQDIPITLW